jgi:L-fuculose-phosphate aldolase
MEQIAAAIRQVLEAGKRMQSYGLVTATWGNISCRVKGSDLVAITPSGMDYDRLTDEDIVIIDMKGTVKSGIRKPSVELPMHLHIYNNRADVAAIVHTHSLCATVFACVNLSIEPIVEEIAQLVGGNVRVATYAPPGIAKLAENVLLAASGRNAVLLANHGMVGLGRDTEEALKVCQIVEKAANIAILSRMIGEPVIIPPHHVSAIREFYVKEYGQRNRD